MNKDQWSRMAMLSARKIPMRSGSLLSCVRDFLKLDDAQRQSAKVVVPECIQLDRGGSIRVLSGRTLITLTEMLPKQSRSMWH